MNALIALIPVTLILIAFAVGLFFWAVRHDQFRNMDTPEILPLLDDEVEAAVMPDDGREPHSSKEATP
ncbi:MAG TPA: cbb3-type cytochrome oxidase assembly protein [Rhodanobacteraceae bacterium]|nr:cbb3-type cytochrome oxidase assembly protein [Rhodanobacteraceae bacterium]